MAIGSGFVPYLSLIMEILSQAGATTADSNDMAMVEFVWTMRESIVDAFIGIMNGLKIGDRESLSPLCLGHLLIGSITFPTIRSRNHGFPSHVHE